MRTSFKNRALLTILLGSAFFLSSLSGPPTTDPAANRTTSTHTANLSRETQLAVAYLAEREELPPERLQVANTYWQAYPDLGRRYWAVTVFDDPGGRQFYRVLVDPDEDRAVEIATVETAQRQARRKRYGKLTPELYERLQKAAPDEKIQIAVWFMAPDRPALLAQLAARHPELQAAEAGSLLDERSLSEPLRAEYERLEQQAHLARQAPLANLFRAEGYETTTYPNLPSLSAHVPAGVIHEIGRRDDVVAVYLVEGEIVAFLDSALASNRGDLVHKKNIKGEDILIGVIDTSSVEDNAYIDVSEAQHPDYIVDSHATRVAGVIVSTHPTLRGMVPAAKIASAPLTDITEMPEKLDWFLSKNVQIINGSFGVADETDTMQWVDRVVDYYVRYKYLTYVAAIGNYFRGNHIGSPAKAYNVISVGGFADKNNANWSDDEMWDDRMEENGRASPWQDPYRDTGVPGGDREKPEVVAVAKDLDIIDYGSDSVKSGGTSLAAPQVAGLAAMLVQQDENLSIWPEGIKTIIMASAIHNIEGESGLSEKDGAGAIDAAQAHKIMEQTTYAFRRISYNGRSSDSWRDDDYLQQEWSFEVKEGDRVRVVIAWASNPDDSFAPGTNALDTNLDLVLVDPFNNTVAYSPSNDNNYEIVDFVAPVTGAYKILVYRDPDHSSESLNSLGLAWTKVSRYDANFLSHAISGLMEPDRDYTYPVTVQNDGNVDTFADGYDDWTWPDGGDHPVNLGCRWYDRDGNFTPVAVDRRTPLPASLPPGDTVTVMAAVHTPAALGRYTLKCDLVHEGIFWFEDTGDGPLTLSVVVTDDIRSHYLPLVIRN